MNWKYEAIEKLKEYSAKKQSLKSIPEEMARLEADTSATEAQREEARKSITPDVVVVDPPRKGCDRLTLDSVVKMNPKKIVMISCNPLAASRDSLELVKAGYKIKQWGVCDMFPRTSHVEMILEFSL